MCLGAVCRVSVTFTLGLERGPPNFEGRAAVTAESFDPKSHRIGGSINIVGDVRGWV